eukprot:CAMPEP_0204223402 /NCGR_PEP_ID=MMETSP0361-20130328/82798_1 /ASSEMBLY_ACC=CAM_ASM_000343 /TAXON_ID=268821 /ORGANISM="Scrippsiella Hangoei, Strain SHTV-5" /LENGTH=147 /DNA_ID=CAMNT_0051189159 /DNA_START=188 /DNA_END=630 /DNA_ORIENTATION=+
MAMKICARIAPCSATEKCQGMGTGSCRTAAGIQSEPENAARKRAAAEARECQEDARHTGSTSMVHTGHRYFCLQQRPVHNIANVRKLRSANVCDGIPASVLATSRGATWVLLATPYHGYGALKGRYPSACAAAAAAAAADAAAAAAA